MLVSNAVRCAGIVVTSLSVGFLSGCVEPVPSEPTPTTVVAPSVIDYVCDGNFDVYVISSAWEGGEVTFEQRFTAGVTGTLDAIVLDFLETSGVSARVALYASDNGHRSGLPIAEVTLPTPVSGNDVELVVDDRPTLEQGTEYVVALNLEVDSRVVTKATAECPGKGLTIVGSEGPIVFDNDGYDVLMSTRMTPA